MGVASKSVVSVSDDAVEWLLGFTMALFVCPFFLPEAGGRRDSPWWGNRVIAALIVGTARTPTSFTSDRGLGTYSTRSIFGFPIYGVLPPFPFFRGGGGSIKEDDELPLSPSSKGTLHALLFSVLVSALSQPASTE